MNYQTYSPDEILSGFVKCFWSLEAPESAQSEKQRIVPDGCFELIIHYGDLYRQFLPDGSFVIQPRSFVFGQVTAPLEIAPTGITGIIAVRFHLGGFSPFIDFPLKEMENKAVPLNQVFPDNGEKLEQEVLACSSHEQRIAVFENFLIERLKQPQSMDRVIKNTVNLLMQSKGQSSVKNMSQELKISRRQLERKFASAIGLSPKQMSKILRLQNVLTALNQKNYSNLTSLALENGYFDQAHFNKDFKELTGMNPKQFYADHLKLSVLFVQG